MIKIGDPTSEALIRILAELEVVRTALVKAGAIDEESYDAAVDETERQLLELAEAEEEIYGDSDADMPALTTGEVHEA
jgi:DNA-binding transcriptional regulator PaaX